MRRISRTVQAALRRLFYCLLLLSFATGCNAQTTIGGGVSIGGGVTIGGGSSGAQAPVFSPTGGTYASPQSVSISCPRSSDQATCTTDGSTPNIASPLCSGIGTISTTTTVKAICSDTPIYKAETQNSSINWKCVTQYAQTYGSLPCEAGGGVTGQPTNVSLSFASIMNYSQTSTGVAQSLIPYTFHTTACQACNYMAQDLYVEAQGTTIQNNEMDMFLFNTADSTEYMIGLQSNEQAGKMQWQIDSGSSWVNTGVTTGVPLSTSTYTHVTLGAHWTVGTPDSIYYDNLCVNNACANLNTLGAQPTKTLPGGWQDAVGNQHQLDSTSAGGTIGRNIQHNTVAAAIGAASSVTSATYTIAPVLATPTASPAAGTYSSAQSVTLSGPSGAAICYTTDGSTPAAATAGACSHGTAYSSPVSVAASLTLKALATEAGYTNSGVLTAAYVISGGGGGSATVVLCPNANQTGDVANCAPSPTLAFGKQGTGTASMAIPVSINNCASSYISGCTGSGTLNVSAMSISGANSGDFSISGTCGAIASGSACEPTVTFTPSASSGTAETATLTVTSDAANGATQTMALTGTSATVTALSACGALSSNTNYQLSGNLTASGTCLTTGSASNVDLNLNGHTITYCNSSSSSLVAGILINGYIGALTVHNGSIVYGAGSCTGFSTPNGNSGSGAIVASTEGSSSGNGAFTLFNLDLSTNSPRGKILATYYPGASTLHDIIYHDDNATSCANPGCRSENQGYPIQFASASTSPAETFYNIVGFGGPQGAITTDAPGSTIAYNLLSPGSTITTLSNGFAIQDWGSNFTIVHNIVYGTGPGGAAISTRGVQLAGATSAVTGSTVENNTFIVSQLANDVEYDGCQLGGGYGIQWNALGANDVSNNTVSGNRVIAIADACPGVAAAYSNPTNVNGPNQGTDNWYECDRTSGSTAYPCTGARFDAYEYPWKGGAAPNGSMEDTGATFKGDTSALYIEWDGTSNWTCTSCTFGPGTNPQAGGPLFLDYDNGLSSSTTYGGSQPFTIIDPTFLGGMTAADNNLSDLAGNNPTGLSFYYTIEWTYTVTAEKSSNSAPISGAAVTVKDSTGATECSGTTDASGVYSCAVKDTKYAVASGAYSTTNLNPAAISISASGCTTLNYNETITAKTAEMKQLSGC